VLPTLLAAAVAVAVVLWRPAFGIALALALAPLANLQAGDGLKPLQPLLPALAVSLVAYSFLAPHRTGGRTVGGVGLALLAFLLSAIASSAQAIAPGESVKKVTILLTAAAIFFAVTQFCGTRASLAVVVGGALAGLALAGAHGVAQNSLGLAGVAGFVSDGDLVQRVQGTFGHPNQYGGYLAFLIPVAAAVAATRGLGALRGLGAAGVVLALPALVFTYARGAIGGLVLGSLVWLGVVRPKLAVVVAVVVGASALLLAPATLRERFDPQATREDVPLRADIWAAAIDIYGQSPVLGVGIENYPEAYERLPGTVPSASQRRYLNEDELLTPPHAQNLYLNVLAEQGIVGIGALAALLGAALLLLYRASKAVDPLVHAVGLGAGAGTAGMLLHSLLEVTMLSELALPLFGLLAVAAVGVGLEPQRRRSDFAPPLTTGAVATAEAPEAS
jgi:O-antigen ligase